MSVVMAVGEVWVFDFSVEDPEADDQDGWQSVHRGKAGAIRQLIAKLGEHGVDYAELSGPDGPHPMVVSHCIADNGSETVELVIDLKEISYSIHRMPIEN
jgi:hypothetical protein